MLPSLSASLRTIGAGCTQWPTPELASECQGNFSPGSCLRAGATSECASTRCDGTLRRSMMPRRKFRIAPVMAAIDDLDADRTGVDVLLARPRRDAGMPGAAGFGHALHD